VSRDSNQSSRAAAQRAKRKLQRRGRAHLRNSFLSERSGNPDLAALQDAMAKLLAMDSPPLAAGPDQPLKVFPTSDTRRWVPIGPSVVRSGQAEGRPRVTGRIRDLAISSDGSRAYAASAKGGVWYTGDGGSTWSPVGGWAEKNAVAGGSNNAQACAALLVAFGATVDQDYVLVGTGEPTPRVRATGHVAFGGLGILAARGPAAAGIHANPWGLFSGMPLLEGLGMYRLVRDPTAVAGTDGALTSDRVLAATTSGLFLGTFLITPPIGPIPAIEVWTWAKVAGLDTFAGGSPAVTDVLWLPFGPAPAAGARANGRIVVALGSQGVAFSDNLGANWTWVTGLSGIVAPQPVGRLSIALATGPRLYVLGELAGPPVAPTLWQIPDISVAAPAATMVPGVPANLWGTQRDYDQALAVDVVGGLDLIYLGGSTVAPSAGANWSASLWCFQTPVAAPALAPATNVSTLGVPPGAGADQAGLIGNNVHADVHAIKLTGAAGANRQVWVGCDGGVFVSSQAGRVNSFLSRVTGLATLEVGFLAHHPTSAHFLAIGCQDNGTQVRVGETVWQETLLGDGGGLVFHPILSQYLVAQYTTSDWLGRPTTGFVDPITRTPGGTYPNASRESRLSAFYSGASAVQVSSTVARIALGTNRVWMTQNLGSAAANSWRVLPFPNGTITDPRPGGTDPVAQQNVGVPVGSGGVGSLGRVIQLRWAGPRDLLAVYDRGIVRYIEHPTTHVWTATVLLDLGAAPPLIGATVLTDVAPVPESSDFYLTTTGDQATPPGDTCWYFNSATSTFVATNLRSALPAPSPLDPAYSVVVDPNTPTEVYVGTVTGVWKGTRTAGPAHAWVPFVNGLPQAAVQDLSIWTAPAGAPAVSPRLLRAAVQSRGVWEVDLASVEAQRTYVRVHEFDDRRSFPTPMKNPRRAPSATSLVAFSSPDIVVRPAETPAAAPAWPLAATATISSANAPAYQVWTFQTAFRWIYPSIAASGTWSDQFGDLIVHHRNLLGLPAGAFIDQALWNAVVGTRLTATGAVSAVPGDPLAVYRAPWQNAFALNVSATEVDLIELVVPPRTISNTWQVFRAPSIVDVLLHHRDSRPLPANDAFVILLWRSSSSSTTLRQLAPTGIVDYARSLLTAAPLAVPAGWNAVAPAVGQVHRLPITLDARLPRALSIPVDFSAVPVGHRVMIMAIVGSTTDPLTQAVVGAPTTLETFVRAWPHAALRLLQLATPP
jgi:hypothetical protein